MDHSVNLLTTPDYRAKLNQCIHCGMCLEACPTYAVFGTEMDGPRGRIALMRAASGGRINLANPNGAFVVVHLIGSHPHVCDRSPIEYFRTHDVGEQTKIENCYDNSIAYTDYVLNEIMTLLEDTDSRLIYTSDHGVTMLNHEPYFLHGLGQQISRSAFEVPLFFWDSKSMENPAAIQKT